MIESQTFTSKKMKHKSTLSTKNDAKRKKVENSAEEKRLEELLFGKIEVGNSAKKAEDLASFEEDGDLDSNKQENEEAEDYEDINFTIDTKPDLTLVEQSKLPENNDGQAAWHDEDDEDLVIDLNQTNRLKKLAYSDKNVQNKTVVTGKEYSELLKQRFDASQKKNVWANPNLLRQALKRKSDDDDTERYLDDEDYQLLQEAESMTVKRGKSDANKWLPLTDGKILVHRLQDITFEEAASSPITSTHFHRDQSLVLVASDDKHLRLFRMNEENSQNKKVLNMQFNDLTIKNAKFIGSQHEELIVCGRRPFYYCYNLQSGQVTKIPKSLGIETTSLEHMSVSPEGSRIGFVGSHGYIHIVDSNTKQWAMDMKMNSTLKSLSFLSEYECVSSGFDADIYFWDLRFPNGKCINKFQHEDGTATSHLSTYLPPQHSSTSSYNYYSLPNAFLSVGAISGVNSIYEGFFQTNSTVHDFTASPYEESDVKGRKFGGTPKPLKSVMNLTTKITTSSFHPSGQILAIASNEKKDQLKLVHLPSCSVFQNWPLSSTPLHNVQTVEFSGNGKYMSIGNKRGKVLLYQLNHFL